MLRSQQTILWISIESATLLFAIHLCFILSLSNHPFRFWMTFSFLKPCFNNNVVEPLTIWKNIYSKILLTLQVSAKQSLLSQNLPNFIHWNIWLPHTPQSKRMCLGTNALIFIEISGIKSVLYGRLTMRGNCLLFSHCIINE